MTVSKYQKELEEMALLWNCDERKAIQIFLHTIYILRGNKPESVAEFINQMSDERLSHCFVAFMDDWRRVSKPIDLLSIQPWRGF